MAMRMYCKLNQQVITKEKDFIPVGTPVQVIGWNKFNGKMIDVKVTAYMFYSDTEAEISNGNIHSGLELTVRPEILVYEDSLEVVE